jgi:putative serine protease PepD
MTQLPPPQPPENEPQHTVPLWQEQTPYPPYPPVPPVESSQAPLRQPGPAQQANSRRLAELVVIAVIAAILASAGTYAVTRNNVASSPTVQSAISAPTSPPPVLQANPAAPDWSAIARAVSPSVVAITVTSSNGGGQGSGVMFDAQGHVLTNNHVVAAGGTGSQISVTLNDKRTYDATVVGTDPSTDLAVIKLTNAPGDLKAIALGDAHLIKVGDQVMAVGNPLGLAGTVTTGIVSALNRPVTTSDQTDPFSQQSTNPVVTNAIQTSAAINPGNSGGALVNDGGQLIGINSAIASLGSSTSSSQGGNIGIGFAIPVNEARSIASQLISTGTATHPYLGVAAKDGVVADGSAKRAAAVLSSVVGGTPADKAGLQTGEAVIAIDGNNVDSSLSMVAQVHEFSVGDTVTVTVVHNGRRRDVNVTLIAKPAGQ